MFLFLNALPCQLILVQIDFFVSPAFECYTNYRCHLTKKERCFLLGATVNKYFDE